MQSRSHRDFSEQDLNSRSGSETRLSAQTWTSKPKSKRGRRIGAGGPPGGMGLATDPPRAESLEPMSRVFCRSTGTSRGCPSRRPCSWWQCCRLQATYGSEMITHPASRVVTRAIDLTAGRRQQVFCRGFDCWIRERLNVRTTLSRLCVETTTGYI